MKIRLKAPICFFLLTAFYLAEGKEVLSHNNTLTTHLDQDCVEFNANIKQLLKDKNFSEAYAQIDKAIKERRKAVKKENDAYILPSGLNPIQNKFAFAAQENIYRIIADAPLLTFDEKYSSFVKSELDINEIRIKFFAALSITTEQEPTQETADLIGSSRDEINKNRIKHVSKILKTFRKLAEGVPLKKESSSFVAYKERENANKEMCNSDFINSLIESRKTESESYINFLEKSYARMLLAYYPHPTDVAKIKHAIRDAGYDGREVNEMLFRTLREYPGAEFLFKEKAKNETRKNKK